MNKSRFIVRSGIKRFTSEENLENQMRNSRLHKLTIREERKIINLVKKNPKRN